jgi:hypothetical protein
MTCQNNGPVCTCTSDFYANGGMCAASKSYIKWQNIFRVTTSVRFIVFFYLLITWLISNYIEWVSDRCLTPIQLYHGENKLILQWDDDEVRFVLDQHAELDFYSVSSLKQPSTGRHVAPLGHIILI